MERGYPTKPTNFLKNYFKDDSEFVDFDNLEQTNDFFLKPFKPTYALTIKGDDQGDRYPARDFFDVCIEKYLPDYAFIKNLIIPECPFSEMLAFDLQLIGAKQEWCVDFFFPLLNLVIEIDGAQHNLEPQKSIDLSREIILRKHGIRTHRIDVKKLVESGEPLEKYFQNLKMMIDASPDIQSIKSFLENKGYEKKRTAFDLTALSRFQRVIIELVDCGAFSEDRYKKIEIKQDFNTKVDWPRLALQDLRIICEAVRGNFSKSKSIPEIDTEVVLEFSDALDSLKLEMNVFHHIDDRELSSDTIYVFNDLLCVQYLPSKDKPIKKARIINKPVHSMAVPTKSKRFTLEPLARLNQIIFGHDNFRPGQAEIISAAILRGSVLGLLPTGGGKSLCFQLMGLAFPGCSIVVCPITALVRDHYLELLNYGFHERADFISAEKVGSERDYTLEKLKKGALKFLFVSPEQFQKTSFREIIQSIYQRNLLARFVIDEVHCISEWGHDFRTAYLNLASTINKFAPTTPVICLTATASMKVIEDIQLEFKIEDDDISYHMDRSRHELSFHLIKPENKADYLKKLLLDRVDKGAISNEQPFLIFSQTVNNNPFTGRLGVTGIAELARKAIPELKVGTFSGGEPKHWDPLFEYEYLDELIPEEARKDIHASYKELVQKKFKQNDLSGIVATKAFGMGVNKSNVRLTIHYGMPQSMESLYQEAGRAGRDQKPANCVTLFSSEKKIPEKLHLADTSLEDLIKIQKEMSKSSGDLSQQLFFLTTSNKTIENELSACLDKINYLRGLGPEGQYTINEMENEKDRARTEEKIIYRLKQLGYVSDWTVEDFIHGVYVVAWCDQDCNNLGKHIVKTISKYSGSDGNLPDALAKIDATKNIEDEREREGALIKVLLDWNYSHFVYQRRQSLKNLYEACESYESPEKFKSKLEAYFQTSGSIALMSGIISSEASASIQPVLSMLSSKDGQPLRDDKLTKISASVSRYLESYQNNPGLNLASALVRALSNQFDNADGLPRFESFLSSLGNWMGIEENIYMLVEFLSKTDRKLSEPVINLLLARFSNVDLAKSVLLCGESVYAERIIYNNINTKLEAIL